MHTETDFVICLNMLVFTICKICCEYNTSTTFVALAVTETILAIFPDCVVLSKYSTLISNVHIFAEDARNFQTRNWYQYITVADLYVCLLISCLRFLI